MPASCQLAVVPCEVFSSERGFCKRAKITIVKFTPPCEMTANEYIFLKRLLKQLDSLYYIQVFEMNIECALFMRLCCRHSDNGEHVTKT